MTGWALFGVASLIVCFGGFGFWMTRGRVVVAVACCVLGAAGFIVALQHDHAEQRSTYCNEADR